MNRRKLNSKISKFLDKLFNILVVLWLLSWIPILFLIIFWSIGSIPISGKTLIGLLSDMLGFSLTFPINLLLLFFEFFMLLSVLIVILIAL